MKTVLLFVSVLLISCSSISSYSIYNGKFKVIEYDNKKQIKNTYIVKSYKENDYSRVVKFKDDNGNNIIIRGSYKIEYQ